MKCYFIERVAKLESLAKSALVALSMTFCIHSSCHLSAEIQNITIKWTQLLCSTQSCITQLDKEFRKVPGIMEFSLNQSGGQAEIKWRPNMPFSFSDVNVPMRLVGLSVRDIHIKVRGTLSHDAKTVTLTSIGDHSRFALLNPVVSTPGQQAPVFNLAARQLKPELYQQLVEGETKKMIATVEGQIFMPGRSPAMQIVVEHLTFTEPDDQKKDSKKK